MGRKWLRLFATAIIVTLYGCAIMLGGSFLLVLIAVEMSDDSADKSEVLAFVCENEEKLLRAIEDGEYSAYENKGFIKEIDDDNDAVGFSCGGAGIGSGTSYVGFYYTPDNDMTDVWCAPFSTGLLVPCGNGFEWREPNGDNYYYTEHICGNFYYYEASF